MLFADQLRHENEQAWNRAVDHTFVHDLWAGSVPERVMREYISQDFLFSDAFVALLGSAVANVDDAKARLVYARQVGFIATDEDSYFQRALERLGANKLEDIQPKPATKGFLDLMHKSKRSYPEAVTSLLVAEWLYLDWATTKPKSARPDDWLYSEWIDLHRGPAFETWVTFLRDEVNRVGASADDETKKKMENVFKTATGLELDFFEEAYAE